MAAKMTPQSTTTKVAQVIQNTILMGEIFMVLMIIRWGQESVAVAADQLGTTA